MKLLRDGAVGAERPGLMDAGEMLRDLASVVDDVTGEALPDAGLAHLQAIRPHEPAARAGRSAHRGLCG